MLTLIILNLFLTLLLAIGLLITLSFYRIEKKNKEIATEKIVSKMQDIDLVPDKRLIDFFVSEKKWKEQEQVESFEKNLDNQG